MTHGQVHVHDHAHGHDHDHAHGSRGRDVSRATRALRIALALTATYLVAEIIGGFLSNSLALLADAGHMLTDVGALALSLFVAWFSRQAAAPEKTYGYLRWEILAAFLNGAALLVISIWICVEAVLRFREPEPIATGLMLVVAVAGLGVNVVSAWVLHGSHAHSLNIRGAYLHVLGDLFASIATIAAALIVRTTGWLVADPITSVLSTVLIVRGAWRLVIDAVNVLLEATPAHISIEEVRSRIAAIAHVESVHDLHVWTVTSGIVAMSAHAIVREPEHHQGVLEAVHGAMQELGIGHVTMQLERCEMYERELHLHP